MTKQEFINQFVAKAPGPIISRQDAAKLTGNTKSIGHLANLAALGLGCTDRVRIGRRMGYISRSFAVWFADQITGLED